MKKALVGSTTTHALLILLPLILGGGGGQGDSTKPGEGKYKDGGNSKREGSNTKGKIIPKETLFVELMDPSQGQKQGNRKPASKKKIKKKECQGYFYGGVGITVVLGTGLVTDVVPGYVAYRMGLEVGDTILGDNEITGEIGTSITLQIQKKDGTLIEMTLVREKICTDA